MLARVSPSKVSLKLTPTGAWGAGKGPAYPSRCGTGRLRHSGDASRRTKTDYLNLADAKGMVCGMRRCLERVRQVAYQKPTARPAPKPAATSKRATTPKPELCASNHVPSLMLSRCGLSGFRAGRGIGRSSQQEKALRSRKRLS